MPAYNVQTAVDAEHGIIVAQQVTTEATDNRSLLPMAEAANQAVGEPATLHVVADAGYSNGEQAAGCEAKGIVPHVPANRGVNNQGDGTLFDASEFHYEEEDGHFRCPAGEQVAALALAQRSRWWSMRRAAQVCGNCPLRSRCTTGSRRTVTRHLYEDALQRMQQRATTAVMRLRRCLVELPFAVLKYCIFGHPRFLLRGRDGAETEISLGTMAYNLKRMMSVLGGAELREALAS